MKTLLVIAATTAATVLAQQGTGRVAERRTVTRTSLPEDSGTIQGTSSSDLIPSSDAVKVHETSTTRRGSRSRGSRGDLATRDEDVLLAEEDAVIRHDEEGTAADEDTQDTEEETTEDEESVSAEDGVLFISSPESAGTSSRGASAKKDYVSTVEGGKLAWKDDKLHLEGVDVDKLPKDMRLLPLETADGQIVSLLPVDKKDHDSIRGADLAIDAKKNQLVLLDEQGKKLKIPEGAYLIVEGDKKSKVMLDTDKVATVDKKGNIVPKLYKATHSSGGKSAAGSDNPFARVASANNRQRGSSSSSRVAGEDGAVVKDKTVVKDKEDGVVVKEKKVKKTGAAADSSSPRLRSSIARERDSAVVKEKDVKEVRDEDGKVLDKKKKKKVSREHAHDDHSEESEESEDSEKRI